MDGKFKEDMPEDTMLDKWPKLLDLQVKLPDPGETAALVEMRTMCPGKPATQEEIEEACRETPFRTPSWKGNSAKTDIPQRVLAPAEVKVINNTYLKLNAAFLAKRQGQDAGEAIAEAEQNLTSQNLKAQELLVEFRREMHTGIGELKGMVQKKSKKNAEEYWYIQAVDGAYYKHESGYHHEVADLNVTGSRYDMVAIVNKNADGTWAYRGKCGIKATPAEEFESDPVCDQKRVTVNTGKNRGKTGVVVAEPKPAPCTELGGDTDVFKVLLDGRKQKSSFTRTQLTFLDASQPETIAAAPSAPAIAKGRKRATPGRGATAKGKRGAPKGRGKRPQAEKAPPGLTEETVPCEEPKDSTSDGGTASASIPTTLAQPPESASAVRVAERTPSTESEQKEGGPARAQKRPRVHASLPPDSDTESAKKPDPLVKKRIVDEESVETSDSDEQVVKPQPAPQVLRTQRLRPCQFSLFPKPVDRGCVPLAVA
jgi:hypothetical protein